MGTPIILVLLIAVTALVSFKGFKDYSFFSKYEFHIGSILKGEKYRMISSAFLHGDLMHLAFNMFTLFMFAPIVNQVFGSVYFLILYFGSLIVGSALTLYFYKNNYNYRAIGASGAVMGIVYAAILINPEMKLFLLLIPIPIPAYLFGIGYLFYSIYGMKANKDNIGHAAHFGGALGGLVLTLVRAPQLLESQPLIIGLLLIPIAVLLYMVKSKRI